ncbi:MAG: hypothetical protein RJA61_361 [Candidatus Parcubacteria bacterium]|jgi:hypothetical protein
MSKSFREKKVINPERDWFFILVLSAIFFSVVIAYNTYVFKKIENGTFVTTSSEVEVTQTLQKDSIDKAVEVVNSKKEIVEKVLQGEFDVADPSL